MSNGAAMSMAMACTTDDRFAAIGPVAGAVFVSDCTADQLTPTLAIHGDADVLAPYDGGDTLGFDLGLPSAVDQLSELAALDGCAGEPTVETIGDDVEHRVWPGCVEEGDGAVELYTVLDGGHTWPGSALSAEAATADESGSGGNDSAEGDQADAVEDTFGFDLEEILGTPTQTIDATELILDFFDRHER